MLHPYTSPPQKQIRCLKVRCGGQTGDYIFTFQCGSNVFFFHCGHPDLISAPTKILAAQKVVFMLPGHMIDCRKCHAQYVLWSQNPFVAEEKRSFYLYVLLIPTTHHLFFRVQPRFTKSDDWNEQPIEMREHFILMTNNTSGQTGSKQINGTNST